MDLNILRRFIHIARVGSFTQAAEDLHVAQPALSKQMKRLEEDLGTKLFHRTGRGIKLTIEGRTLLQHSQQILSSWGQARQSIQDVIDLDRGHVRLITFTTFAFYLLPHILIDFVRTYPHLDIEIEQAITEPVVQQVMEHHFEAGIACLPVGHSLLNEVPLYIEESAIIVNRDHRLYGYKEIPAAEVGEHLLITSSLNPNYRAFLWSVFQNLDVQLKVQYVIHYYPMVISLVKAGLGAGLAPIVALSPEDIKDGSISAIHIVPPLQRTIGWVELRGIIRSQAVDTFFNFLVEYLRRQDIVTSLI
jgi:DNA-binding transcriptional LysR family regulator